MKQMMFMRGTVVNTYNADYPGRLQIRPLPYLKDVSVKNLPWVRPFFNEYSTVRKDTVVWLISEASDYCDFQNMYWLGPVFFQNLNQLEEVKTIIGSVDELDSIDEEAIKFNLLENGNLIYENLATGDSAYVHNTGSYIVFASNGEITLRNGSGILVMKSNGTIDFNNGNLEVLA